MIKTTSFNPNTTISDREIYRVLMESTSEAVFVIELGDLSLLEMNQSAARLLGYSIDELLALGLGRLLPGLAPQLRAAAGGAEPLMIEQELSANGGRAVSCALTVRRIDDPVRPKALVIARTPDANFCGSSLNLAAPAALA